MLEWLGIAFLYVAAISAMVWWILRARRQSHKDEVSQSVESPTTIWRRAETASAQLDSALDQALRILEKERQRRPSDLVNDWLNKSQQAFSEGKRLILQAQQLHQSSQIKSDSPLVNQRIEQNLAQRDELLDRTQQVIQALELVAVDAPRYFQWDGRPLTQATDALTTAVEAALRLEREWSQRDNKTKLPENT